MSLLCELIELVLRFEWATFSYQLINANANAKGFLHVDVEEASWMIKIQIWNFIQSFFSLAFVRDHSLGFGRLRTVFLYTFFCKINQCLRQELHVPLGHTICNWNDMSLQRGAHLTVRHQRGRVYVCKRRVICTRHMRHLQFGCVFTYLWWSSLLPTKPWP